MHSMTHRSRLSFAALAVLLSAPAPAFAADEADWGFRQAFRGYVYGGTGAPPITAAAGATCASNPDTVRGGCDPKLAATTGVFGWTATGSDYTIPGGAGTIDLQGTVTLTRPDHFFTMAIIDPVVTIDANGDAVVDVHVDLDSGFPSVPDFDGRLNFGAFELLNLTVTATTVTWELGNGVVTDEAATALGNFLTAGSALDPIRIVLPIEDEPAGGTPIASTGIQLRDDPAKPDKRGLTVSASKQPLIVPADMDPSVDGATVRVVSSTFDGTYALPASNWKVVLKKGGVVGYNYTDPKRLLGPISSVKVGVGKLKIGGKGAGLTHTLTAEPQDVAVVLSSGDVSFCTAGGATSKVTYKTGKSYKAAKNAAPAACPAS